MKLSLIAKGRLKNNKKNRFSTTLPHRYLRMCKSLSPLVEITAQASGPPSLNLTLYIQMTAEA